MSPRKPPAKRDAPSKAPRERKRPAPRRRRVQAALPDVPTDKAFWVNFGPILRNLSELRDALADGLTDAQFAHHVTADRNDFAAWVEHVIGDLGCAKALRRARSRAAALRAVEAGVRRAR